MGRHAAADGAGTDPIVAAALASQADGGALPRHAPADDGAPQAEGPEGDLGWPGDTTTGGGLGWPGSADRTDATARMDAVPSVPGTDGAPEPPGPRGWRRLLGGRAA
jgi:hypothetical protein